MVLQGEVNDEAFSERVQSSARQARPDHFHQSEEGRTYPRHIQPRLAQEGQDQGRDTKSRRTHRYHISKY